MSRLLTCLAAAAVLPLASSTAQVIVSSPNFSVELVASNVAASGESMAIDRFGNAYIVNKTAANDTVVIVRPNGSIVPSVTPGFTSLGQLAYHPLEGAVYAVETAPVLPVLRSVVWRLSATAPPQIAFELDVTTQGFTIDNAGTFFFGGVGLQGSGLYSVTPPSTSVEIEATFRGPGFGQNERLQSLVSGDVLIASGDEVRRWTNFAVGTVPFYDHPGPFPNDFALAVGLARNPMNQLGSGAIVGIRDLETFGIGGEGLGIATDLLGNELPTLGQAFLSEEFDFGEIGLLTLAAGIEQDLYWFSNACDDVCPTIDAPNRLYRIRQQPGVGSQGSLFAGTAATGVTFDLYGPAAGGAPFVLGIELIGIFLGETFLPPWGVLGPVPGAPGTIALLDGIGLSGPPNPFAVIPSGGAFSITFPLPPGLSGLSFRAQDLILAPAEAPNGFFFISNEVQLTLP